MRFVLLGEQATGKSSLLVALYGALVNRRAGGVRIIRTIDDVEFLSRGLQAFGRRESLRRTDLDSRARLLIEVAQNDVVARIELPDRSGELLKHMLDARIWDPELRQQVIEAEGAMLFLRADQFIEDELPTVLADDALAPPVQAVSAGSAAWSPGQMPADVRAVDLLQALLNERSAALPIAMIVSAWDRVGVGAGPPGAWLSERVPLVAQFLASNAKQLPYAVFGVSAQGAEFSEGEATGGSAEDPWDRAFLVGPDGTPGTLAEPVVWLLDAAR